MRQHERTWFECRAIAESVKTTAWRYAMRIKPFAVGDDALADRMFIEALAEIRQTWRGLEKHITQAGGGAEVTQAMRTLRSGTLEERRALYVVQRLRDQRVWYERKCVLNRTRAGQWFWLVVTLQVVALFVAVLQVRYGLAPINLIALLMTGAATSVAWSQSRRHDDLVQSYGLAAHEMRALETLADSVKTEEVFNEFVEQAEGTISREHTMWCARRDVNIRRQR